MGLLLDMVNEVVDTGAQGANLSLASVTATATAASADFSDGEIATQMIVNVATVTAANVTSQVIQAEESATGTGSWTVIPNMVITVTATTAQANLYQKTFGLRSKQYVRLNLNTLAVTTTTGAFGGTFASLFSQRKLAGSGSNTKSGVDRYPSA